MINPDRESSRCQLFQLQKLEKLFQHLSPDLTAIQLSLGTLEGRLIIYRLGALRFNLLESNQGLFFSGTRKPKPWTLAVPLNDQTEADPYRAQGIVMPWIGVMGYNTELKDFDLRIPAGNKLGTLVSSKEQLMTHHQPQRCGPPTAERLHSTNQLELRGSSSKQLRKQLEALIEEDGENSDPAKPDQLMETIVECFEDTKVQTMGRKNAKNATQQQSNYCIGVANTQEKASQWMR